MKTTDQQQAMGITLVICAFAVMGILFLLPAGKEEGVAQGNWPYADRISASLFQTQASVARSIPPTLTARAVLVFDPINKKVVYGSHEQDMLPIASVTKIMTALIALERVNPNDTVIVSEEAVKTEGLAGELHVFERARIRNLVAMMMLESSNDAAAAIAEHVGKIYGAENYAESQALFTQLMNEKAALLGMRSTIFRNPTGLDLPEDAPSNFASAWDLATLAAHITQYPAIWGFSRDEALTLTSQEGISHNLVNINPIIQEQPGLLGSKTGFTNLAGGALITLVEAPLGQLHIIVILGSTYEDRFTDTKKLIDWLTP